MNSKITLERKNMKRLIALVATLIISSSVFGQGAPVPGKEYRPINPPQPVSGNQIEVLEFFSYACPHCDEFEPLLNSWLSSKPEGVAFSHVPAIFNKRMIPLAKLYYTLEETGTLPQLHTKVYDAIHRQGQNLVDRESIMKWAATQDVDIKKFEAAYDSFSVANKTQRAMQLARNYRIPGTPYMVVNGKYLTGPGMTLRADGRGVDGQRFVFVLNTLIDMER
jgi:thiol:disulfide interchange protein DsbA